MDRLELLAILKLHPNCLIKLKMQLKFAYLYGSPWTTSNKVSLKDDYPFCNSRTSSNKFVSTITILSYIPVILTSIIYNLD